MKRGRGASSRFSWVSLGPQCHPSGDRGPRFQLRRADLSIGRARLRVRHLCMHARVTLQCRPGPIAATSTSAPQPTPNPLPCGSPPAHQVDIGCLNNIAPPPLNWKMWCAPDNATVKEYVDEAGATHRIIALNPQPGLTAQAAQWYTSGFCPPMVVFQGKVSPVSKAVQPLGVVMMRLQPPCASARDAPAPCQALPLMHLHPLFGCRQG